MQEQIRTTRNLIIIVVLLSGIALFPMPGCEPEDNPKLSDKLNQLLQSYRQGEVEEFSLLRNIELLHDDAGLVSVKVVIHCFSGQVEVATKAAETYGTVGITYRTSIQVVVPLNRLSALADEESIEYIELPEYAVDE